MERVSAEEPRARSRSPDSLSSLLRPNALTLAHFLSTPIPIPARGRHRVLSTELLQIGQSKRRRLSTHWTHGPLSALSNHWSDTSSQTTLSLRLATPSEVGQGFRQQHQPQCRICCADPGPPSFTVDEGVPNCSLRTDAGSWSDKDTVF
jgi:hypothetical protein